MYQSTVLQNTTLQSSLLMPILYLIQKCKDITRNNSTVFRTFSFTASQRLFLIRHWLGVLICCHVTGRELTLASARLLKFKLFLRKGKWANFNWLWMWRGCRCCSENCRKCCSEGMFTHRPPFMFVKKKPPLGSSSADASLMPTVRGEWPEHFELMKQRLWLK